MFRYDVFSGYESDVLVDWRAVVVGCNVSEFDEGVSVVDGLQNEFAEVFEPLLVKDFCCFGVLCSVSVVESERACHDEVGSLCDASSEVCVSHGVSVDVEESCSVGVFGVDGLLPCSSPSSDVGSCEAFSLEVDVDGLFFVGFCESEGSEGGANGFHDGGILSQRDKETKSQRDEETKRQRVKETKSRRGAYPNPSLKGRALLRR